LKQVPNIFSVYQTDLFYRPMGCPNSNAFGQFEKAGYRAIGIGASCVGIRGRKNSMGVRDFGTYAKSVASKTSKWVALSNKPSTPLSKAQHHLACCPFNP